MKNYVLPILIIVIGASISGFLLFSGPAGGPDGNLAGNISQENLRKLNLNIDGMFCIGCSGSVEGAVSAMPGVVKVSANAKTDSGYVIYDSSKVTKEEIVKNSIFQVYPATIVSDKKFSGDIFSIGSDDIPLQVQSKLTELANTLSKEASKLTPAQSDKLDRAVSDKDWGKAKTLIDQYLSNLK